MDVAYNQHSREAKRKNRSTTNLNHLTLAPLTTKLPLDHHHHSSDHEQHVTIADSTTWSTASFVHSTSYLQGKSAPTTPGLLSRSPARSRSRGHNGSSSSRRGGASTPTSGGGGGGGSHLPKSKSATHLPAAAHSRHLASHSVTTLSTTTHGGTASVRRRRGEDGFLSATREREDSDWLLRAGAVISSETRESKGQAWLLSRASSTSLSGMRDAEEEALEREMARERELASRSASRRGSLAPGDDNAFYSSPPGSRFGSRSQSRAGSRTQMLTPGERRSVDGYFAEVGGSSGSHERFPEPDFVSLDEALESVEQDTTVEDEADVRRLVKREKAGVGAWLGNMVGWPLFSVQENEEESSEDDEDDEELYTEGSLDEVMLQGRRRSGVRQFEGVADLSEERVPPPKENEGGWQDAAWLLTVASKVLL